MAPMWRGWHRQAPIIWIVCSVVAMSSGCGGPALSVPTVPVTGSVTYKGQPLEGAQIAFIAIDGGTGRSANGVTDGSGTFSLQTFVSGNSQSKGAMPGEYIVTIQKRQPLATLDAAAMLNGDPTKSGPQALTEQPNLLTPPRYADPAKAEKVTVTAGGDNVFKFDLVD